MRFITVVIILRFYTAGQGQVSDWTCAPPVTRVYRRENTDAQFQFDVSNDLPQQPGDIRTCNFAFYDGTTLGIVLYQYPGSVSTYPVTGVNITAASSGNMTITLADIKRNNQGTYRLFGSTGTLGCSCLYILGIPTKPAVSINKTPFVGGSVTLTCRSNSTTSPSNHSLSLIYSWKVNGTNNPTNPRYSYSSNKDTLTLSNILKEDASEPFTCSTTEEVNDGYTSSPSDSFSLDVRYAPDGPPVITGNTEGREYRVIEGTQGQLSCSISGGNPAPILTWDCINSGTSQTTSSGMVTKLHTWVAQRGQEKTCTCRASHYSGNRDVSITIKVLYPPTKPTFKINSTTVSGTIKVIKHNSLSVVCISEGQPAPSYRWTNQTIVISNSQQLIVSNIRTNGRYTCAVQNTMNPSVNATVSGSNSSLIDVLVLFPPVIGELRNVSVVEGSPATVSCPLAVGNPPATTFEWRRNVQVWKRTQTFTIDTTSRTDAMFYTCNVANVMQQTGEQPVSQPDTKSFYLNVWYSATVTEFFIIGHKGETSVTMNEFEPVSFQCNADSNPGSTISITYDKHTQFLQTNTNLIVYSNPSTRCTDSGVYSCVGFNQHNVNNSSRILNLLIKCSPRPLYKMTQTITSVLNVPVTVKFTALAYPAPGPVGFTWQKKNDLQWTPLLSNADFQISSSGLQSNLTILNVSKIDFGHYRLNVTNSIGTFTQYFFLTKAWASTGSNNSPNITGISLGIVVFVLAAYAIFVTILYKRKSTRKATESSESPENTTKQVTYVNLNFKSDATENQTIQADHGGNNIEVINGHNEDSMTQYTSLDRQLKDDSTAYDVLQS